MVQYKLQQIIDQQNGIIVVLQQQITKLVVRIEEEEEQQQRKMEENIKMANFKIFNGNKNEKYRKVGENKLDFIICTERNYKSTEVYYIIK